jgi:hypothetical protein
MCVNVVLCIVVSYMWVCVLCDAFFVSCIVCMCVYVCA